jgi:hypothetical protein
MTAPRLLLTAGLAAAAAFATPATAAERCVGEDSLAYVCVYTPGVGIGSIPLCVYTGGGSCQPVDVPAPYLRGCPGVGWGGSLIPQIDFIAYECTTPAAAR